MKIRIRELCSQAYVQIMSKDEGHYLRQLYLCSTELFVCYE